MARHPWVAAADEGIRWGLQLVVPSDNQALPRLLTTAQRMDVQGFDSVFIMDHPALHVDPYIALAGIGAVTSRLRLGQLVMAAAYRHPAFVARMQADLDNLSSGRSILGLGSGWFEAEYEQLAIPFQSIGTRQKGLDEALEIINGLWKNEPFAFEGEQFQVRGMKTVPPPMRKPPILIGGDGEKTTLRQVATWGDACNLREKVVPSLPASHDPERFAAVAHKFEVLRQYCRDIGRPENELLYSHFTTYLVMASTQAQANAKADQVDTANSTSAGTRSAGRDFLFAASPERAVAYFKGMREVGAQYFVIQVDADDSETIDLLSLEVMPAFV